jgi:hypothetical protein
MDGSLPDLRRHLAGLLAGLIDLAEFQRWFWTNYTAIEQQGSDQDVDLLLLVLNRLAEYTSDYIDASELLDALRTDPLVQDALAASRSAVAYRSAS